MKDSSFSFLFLCFFVLVSSVNFTAREAKSNDNPTSGFRSAMNSKECETGVGTIDRQLSGYVY